MVVSSPRKVLWYLTESLGIALGYIVVAMLALELAIPPGYATPLYPSAGLALAALVSLGLRYAPAVLVGAFLVNGVLGIRHEVASPLLLPLVIGIGSMLQALVGAWAVRRWVTPPRSLTEPRDLARFFGLGAGLACLISPSVGTGALLLFGEINSAQIGGTWSAWWLGDTMGVLIGAPMVLTLIGRPRKAWRTRRLNVGLPMLATTVLVAVAIGVVTRWDQQRARSMFERDAANAGSALEARLREPLMALEASRGLMLVAPKLSRLDFERATANYLPADGPLLAMGMARRVARDALAPFNTEAQAEGLRDYQARDRKRPGDLTPPPGEDLLAIRLIEPLPRNGAALGVNIRSIPVARAALQEAVRSGRATATAGFHLSQDSGETTGVVVYQPFYDGSPGTAEGRDAALLGVVFATLRPDLLVQGIEAGLPPYLKLCLVDTAPGAQRPHLGGPKDCAGQRAEGVPLATRRVDFGGRDWEIRAIAAQGVPLDGARSWPFALVGLFSAGLLGILLLLVTGRARRIEDLVLARTAELKREVAGHERSVAALTASEQRFRNIFDQAPVGIVFTDVSSAFQDANPHFCQMLGYSAEQLRELRSLEITHPEDRAEDIRLARQVLSGEISQYRRHKRYYTADGRLLHARVVVSALRSAKGEPYRLVGVVEDIADQLKMQELARAAQAAEAANQAKNEFLSRMSHELRTPLNAMLGFTQLLEMDGGEPLSSRQQARTAQIQQAGWHLLEMINDTLDLSRIESGALKLEPVRLSLDRMLDEAQALIEGDANQRQLRLARSLGVEAQFLYGDATRVKQVLTNLLSNAVKYNVDGGSITIRSRRPSRAYVDIAIEDSGLGMNAEQLAELFQPFNRLGREHGGTAGTGIGLVISKRLAELMGGTLSASSEAGRGSSFVLRLPAAEWAGTTPAAEPADVVAPARPAFAGRRRVAYIEDNAMNAELMRGALEQRPQIDLQVYTDGESGLAAVLADPPDLLLLDMQLPGIDGLAVLRRLRATLTSADLPVVVVSANALPDQIQASEAAGAQHYFTKPIDVTALLALLDRLLEKRPEEEMRPA